jgi:DNA-binding CsgD family transcriptional regulator
VNPPTEAAITMTEACYDLHVPDADWFRSVMMAGLRLIDHGLGVAGIAGVKPPTPGPIQVTEMHVASGPPDFPMRHMAAISEFPPEQLHDETMHGNVSTMSEQTAANPWMLEVWTRHVDYAKDGLRITAMDPDGHGLHIMAPLPRVTKLSQAARKRLQMLAAHLSAGHRLRRALRARREMRDAVAKSKLPHGADAVLDPKSFHAAEAVGDAAEPAHAEVLKEKAVAIDRARGRLRKDDPAEALATWEALVQGRWSIVEWFDSDERRYVLAIPNPPHVLDPRGLSERERQVVGYAQLGESHGLIAYRLGLSRSTVTKALRSAMRKLGAKTHAELVAKLRAAPTPGMAEPQ